MKVQFVGFRVVSTWPVLTVGMLGVALLVATALSVNPRAITDTPVSNSIGERSPVSSAVVTMSDDCTAPSVAVPLATIDDPVGSLEFLAVRFVLDALGCQPSDQERMCRALWLIGVSDPVRRLALGSTPEVIDRSAVVHRWALGEASDAAGPGTIGDAFDEVGGFVQSDGDRPPSQWDDDRWLTLIRARAAPDVLAALSEVERRCT